MERCQHFYERLRLFVTTPIYWIEVSVSDGILRSPGLNITELRY